MPRRALITGISGQDGRYLADLLLAEGYTVHGLRRPAAERATAGAWRLADIADRLTIHEVSFHDDAALRQVLSIVEADEIYHFSAQSSVSASFRDPLATFRSNVEGTQQLFAAIADVARETRTYFAGSCEMFGAVDHNPADEHTPFHPVSPYGIGKLTAYHVARHYRDAYHVPVTCGIAFNHDSPLRGEEFVTAKIARGVVRIAAGRQDTLQLGNLAVVRDWGWAPEYVQAMWQLMTRTGPDDFVIATGSCCSVQQLVEAAFDEVGLDWRRCTVQDEALRRPTDVPELYGNPTKIRNTVGWSASTRGVEVLRRMVRHELEHGAGR